MNPSASRDKLLRLVQLAMFAAMAYALSALAHFVMPPLFPAAAFLKYDPKDVIIAIGAFLYGPLPGVLLSLLVSLLEMFTISSTGAIGMVMNGISTVCFVCPAAWWYRRHRKLSAAVTGLAAGVLLMAAAMVLWNYLLTPLYMGIPREVVTDMLLPVFLPFNLLKGGLNMALSLLLYKPLRMALVKARLLPAPAEPAPNRHRFAGAWIVGGAILLTCLLVILALYGLL